MNTRHFLFPGFLILITALYSSSLLADGKASTYEVHMMIQGCIHGFMEPTRRDFRKIAVQRGNPNAVFPEEKIKPSVTTLCSCIIKRAAENRSTLYISQHPEYIKQLVSEALSGGQCEPTGFLGELVKRARNQQRSGRL